MPGSIVGTVFALLVYTVASLYCFVLPGYALLIPLSSRRSLTWLEQIALSTALSVSLYPLLYLWAHTIGVSIGPLIAWIPGVVGLIVWLWTHRNWRYAKRPASQWIHSNAFDIALLLLIIGLLLSRLLPVREMIAPAWGDSVHHTIIVQLLLDHGGLFQSWAPYAPIETFTYHFGFHSNMAVWATVTGQTAPQAVITGGQIFNVLAIIALYPVAARLASSRIAGIGAMIVAGLVSQQPGMYVNWGRYTQLTAQIILPVWLWALDVWLIDKRRPPIRFLGIITLLASGLALTHYRVSVVALMAAAAWGLWALWLLRQDWHEWFRRIVWLAGAGVTALALIVPWVFIVRASRLVYIAGALAQRSTQAPNVRGELAVWQNVETYYPIALWAGTLGAAILALWRCRKLAVPLIIWTILAFLAASPFLIRFAGTGIVTNFLLLLGMYIPLSLFAGWLLAEIWRLASALPYGRTAAAIVLVVVSLLGMRSQLAIVDTSFQMVTSADTDALTWIDDHVPPDSRFLVNSFLAYNDSVVAGSDAGWWLPYYTQRANNVPPILYSVEAVTPEVNRDGLLQLVLDMQADAGDSQLLRVPLCEHGITHIYSGDNQGHVGVGETQLLKPEWFQNNPDFRLLHQVSHAQVWSFDRNNCITP